MYVILIENHFKSHTISFNGVADTSVNAIEHLGNSILRPLSAESYLEDMSNYLILHMSGVRHFSIFVKYRLFKTDYISFCGSVLKDFHLMK